jgi:hypothetical protein
MTLLVPGPRFSFVDEIVVTRRGPAQTYSLLVHVLILCALSSALIIPRSLPPTGHSTQALPHHLIFTPPQLTLGALGSGNDGGGGEENLRPTTHGELAPRSAMPLAPPRIPTDHENALPAPPAVFDANAPDAVKAVNHWGCRG